MFLFSKIYLPQTTNFFINQVVVMTQALFLETAHKKSCVSKDDSLSLSPECGASGRETDDWGWTSRSNRCRWWPDCPRIGRIRRPGERSSLTTRSRSRRSRPWRGVGPSCAITPHHQGTDAAARTVSTFEKIQIRNLHDHFIPERKYTILPGYLKREYE